MLNKGRLTCVAAVVVWAASAFLVLATCGECAAPVNPRDLNIGGVGLYTRFDKIPHPDATFYRDYFTQSLRYHDELLEIVIASGRYLPPDAQPSIVSIRGTALYHGTVRLVAAGDTAESVAAALGAPPVGMPSWQYVVEKGTRPLTFREALEVRFDRDKKVVDVTLYTYAHRQPTPQPAGPASGGPRPSP